MEKYKELIDFLKVEISKIHIDAETSFDDLQSVADAIEFYFEPVELISNDQYRYYIVNNRIILIDYDVSYPSTDFEEFHLEDVVFVDLNRVTTVIRHGIMNLEDTIRTCNEDILRLKALAYDLNKDKFNE